MRQIGVGDDCIVLQSVGVQVGHPQILLEMAGLVWAILLLTEKGLVGYG